MVFTLYLSSVGLILAGGACAYLHGLYTRDGKKIAERLAEFGRNAFIQLSAMLFALATALYIFENQNNTKIREQAAAEKSIAYSAIAIRAGLIESKVRPFAVSNRIIISIPDCLYDHSTRRDKTEKRSSSEINDDCKNAIIQEASNSSNRYAEYRSRLDSISEALNIKEDWIKYPYFAKNLDKNILKKFLNLQAILNYRDAEAMGVITQLRSIKPSQYSSDKIVFDMEKFNNAIDRYTKTAIIYLIMYYIAFGDIDMPSEAIEQKQKKLIDDVRTNFELYDKISINQFINTISLRSQECEFQSFKCYELLSGFK